MKFLYSLVAFYKWIILPALAFLMFLIFRDAFLFYSQSKFKQKIEWDVFEIKIPREIEKGPKAMEQFFAGLWSLWNVPTSWVDKYLEGEVTYWYSFELVGSGGRVHFYVRVPKKFRHSIESMLYAQYPDIEISDVEDYVSEVPTSFDKLEKLGYELFGSELRLAQPAPNPINTYVVFEEKGGEERIIDPFSVMLELLSRLRPEERFWIQFVLRPADPKWQKEGEKVMKEIKEKTLIKPPSAAKAQQPSYPFAILTPAEEEKLKVISRKVSKQGFETLIRYLYIAPKDIFDKNFSKNLGVYFNQYSFLNYFVPNFAALTRVQWYKWPFFFPKRREKERKRKILYKYKIRYLPEETASGRINYFSIWSMEYWTKKSSISILNTEEIATLYHL
ncbi:MAG: hypothetical protein ACK4NX_02120, partial [Candidatus Paceibacteria bacterium]